MALVILGRRASSGRFLATSIAAELPIVVFGPASLTLTGAASVVSVAETDDGWLPEGAIAYADFVNGHYYAGGAETVQSALFSGGDASAYIGVDGLDLSDPGQDQLDFKAAGAFLTALTTYDLTLVLELEKTAYNNRVLVGWFDADSLFFLEIFNTEADFYLSPDFDPEILAGNLGDAGIYRIALTLASERISLSVNGGVVAADVMPPGPALTGFSFTIDPARPLNLRTVTVLAAVDDADLPALSAL